MERTARIQAIKQFIFELLVTGLGDGTAWTGAGDQQRMDVGGPFSECVEHAADCAIRVTQDVSVIVELAALEGRLVYHRSGYFR